ncbi:iron-containing alcohol dehydrogenase [Candidatus Sumerlaeota bacterium]|nr:iron-containing alcohol dehydrogenase [Candidatus Sumerlaeota bacterium]
MDFPVNEIYGKTFQCSCGKTHRIDPEQVIYSEDAIEMLDEILCQYSKGRRVAILMDKRTCKAAGSAAANILRKKGWRVAEHVIPDPKENVSPECDDLTYHKLMKEISEPDILLAVGTGVINDLGKWIAFDLDKPYVSLATAASMNGYTSANAASIVDGIKTLIRCRPPRVVVATPSLLRDAPYKMTTAGLADALAKSVSSTDWKMNHILFGDFFCEESVSLIADIEPLYREHPEDIKSGNPGAIESLFSGLLLTGVAMTMAESSAPASGGEHLISHTLDAMSSLDSVPHDLHGRQVGLGTIICSEIYRRLMALDRPVFSPAISGIDAPFWGKLSDGVEKQYSEKVPRIHQAVEILSDRNAWDNLRSQLRSYLRSPEEIRDCLKRAGGAIRAEDIGCSKERLLAALLHAHEFRARFTCLDVARMAGVLPNAAQEIVERWG